jgi:hypothetical protein
MELKVKEVSGPGEKSLQEVEETLMEQIQEDAPVEETSVEDTPVEETKVEDTPVKETKVEETPVVEEAAKYGEEELKEYIKSRYNKEIDNVDDLFAEREQAEELPEDVSAFLKYKKETGRGIEDFMKLQANVDEANPDKLLRDYYSATEEDLDSEDIDYLMEQKFSYDEDLDEDSEIKAKNIAKKRELAKAKKYFNELKEAYKVPVESAATANKEELEDYNAYKEYISKSQGVQEENEKRYEYFKKKTDEVFNDEFKGFGFNIGDQSIMFSPGDTAEVKSLQSDVNNFLSKYLDEDGTMKDASGYHRALSAAMNPDKLATFFYEKGKADGVGDVSRKSKNINMDVRTTPKNFTNTSGIKMRAVSSDSGNGLKIKRRK